MWVSSHTCCFSCEMRKIPYTPSKVGNNDKQWKSCLLTPRSWMIRWTSELTFHDCQKKTTPHLGEIFKQTNYHA